jgi:hypothetical protein
LRLPASWSNLPPSAPVARIWSPEVSWFKVEWRIYKMHLSRSVVSWSWDSSITLVPWRD